MYKAMIMAAALAAIATPALATSATDLVCSITDNRGNALIYTFDGNSHNSDGSLGGTMVETGFSKNGRDTLLSGRQPADLGLDYQHDPRRRHVLP